MRWAAARLLTAFLLLGSTLALPLAGATQHEIAAPAPVLLRDRLGQLDVDNVLRVWFDARGDATIQQVSRPGGPVFRRVEPNTIHDLGRDGALWMHLRVQRAPGERQDWTLDFPMPQLDEVTVYQLVNGAWRGDTAGDTLAVDKWPEPGRYPSFRVHLEQVGARDVYVRLRHATATNIPVLLSTAARQSQRLQLEYMAIGAAFGTLLLLILASTAKGVAYRDPVFGWYAAYASVTSLAVSTYTGTAAHLLWPGFDALRDSPVLMLSSAAVACATLFVRIILALRRRFPLLDRTMLVLAAWGVVSAVIPALLPKQVALPLVGVYLTASTLAVIFVSITVWWRGDTVARWVFAAYFPVVVAVLAAVAQRIFGWLPSSPLSQYTLVAAMLVEVPLLLVALFIRSRDRHAAQVREQALSTQDALTGLLAPHLFTDRLRHVVMRHRRDGEGAAVMYIELVNYRRIREHFGPAVAEQSVLRSVIKLRRLLRDVDTIARVGEACFGVLLEGAASRASVMERATRLIAAGLMPLPGLKPDVTLQFHVAAVMLSEMPLEAEEMEQALRAQLARMTRRTRRPIRFIDTEPPPSSDPGESSVFAPGAAPEDGDLAPAP